MTRASPSADAALPNELVRAAAAGNVTAFAAVVARFQDFAVGYAYALLGELAEAEDAAQDAFIEAYRELPRLREAAAFVSWFRRIVYKHCDRRVRAAKPTLTSLDSVSTPDEQPAILDTMTREETSREVRSAVRSLPDEQRVPVVLYYFAECTLREIAELLEIPEGTVKSRLHTARSTLRTVLSDMTDDLHDNRPSRDETFLRSVMQKLLRAIREDRVDVVSRILADDVSLVNKSGPHPAWGGEPKPLHVAADWGHTTIVERLLDAGADASDRAAGYGGWSPLLLAIVKDHPDTWQLLLRRGAEVGLYEAAALGDLTRVTALVKAEPDLSKHASPSGFTALHFAATPEVARVLVEAGADPNADASYGATPARAAAYSRRRRAAVARFLMERTGEDDIFLRAAIGDVARVEHMLDTDQSLVYAIDRHLNPAMGRGATPLHIAAALDELAVMRLLLERGAIIDSLGEDGSTPLHHAAYHGRIRAAELLIENGADPTIRDAKHDATPRDWAEFFERRELVAWMDARDCGRPELP